MSATRRILLTGVSSFVGCHLAHDLAQAGHTVLAVTGKDPASYDGIRARRLGHARSGGALLQRCDLVQAADFATVVAEFHPEICIHHAGWAERYGAMDYDLNAGHRVNLRPLDHIVRNLAEAGAKALVLTGSSAEYGPSVALSREEEACLPDTPYGLSKLSATLRARQLAAETGLPVRVARVFIPFGALDAPGKVLMVSCAALKEGKEIDLSPCDQARDFLHVSDLVAGYTALMEEAMSVQGFEIVNLSSGEGVAVRDLLVAMAEALGRDPSLLRFGRIAMRMGEAPFSAGSNAKALARLDWRPRRALDAITAFVREQA